MLNKIEKLISIGKFRNYTASGQVSFHKLTTIYGDNGGGKTTITAVLRSLTNNNPSIVKSRISTNHTQPQSAQITCSVPSGLSHHTFGQAGWTSPVADIEIFDIHFVNENVYSGFEFKDDQKKQLHKFVVGAQGVAIQQQIEQNKSDKSALTQAIGNAEQQLITLVGNNLTTLNLRPFLALKSSQATNIDSLIIEAETALQTANSNSTIQTLPKLSQIDRIVTGNDFEEIITNISTTSQSVKDTALKVLFETHFQHLAENTLTAPENWLKDGYSTIESLSKKGQPVACPFCKQAIDLDFGILKAYANLFDESFNDLASRIENNVAAFEKINIDNIILSTETVCKSNDGHVVTWAVHLPSTVIGPINNIISDTNLLKNTYDRCLTTIRQKLQNPTTVVDHIAITEFRDSIILINDHIETYNLKVRTYNAGITNFLSMIQTVHQAQAEVNRLKQIKKRFDPAINTICLKIATDKSKLTSLQNTYSQLSQQQEASATAFFGSYKDRVNHYLETVFRTHFKIDNVAFIPPRGKALEGRMGYKLVIDGKDISFESDQPFSAKECLSEGDKTTIALAFFLSKLDIDPNRSNKVLVFDDPLSSLDTNRRMYTIRLIRSLVNQMKQVIVLSHNEHFLYEICKDIRHVDKKTLRIIENYVAKASIIEVCDLDELVKNEYFKQLEAIIKFRTNPDHLIKDQVLGWLRNVLEGHLNFKFYRILATMPGQKTFGSQIKFLNDQNVPCRENANRSTIISNLNMINSIAWKPHHSDPMPDYSALGINPNSITPSELDNLIVDTLNLIDHQL